MRFQVELSRCRLLQVSTELIGAAYCPHCVEFHSFRACGLRPAQLSTIVYINYHIVSRETSHICYLDQLPRPTAKPAASPKGQEHNSMVTHDLHFRLSPGTWNATGNPSGPHTAGRNDIHEPRQIHHQGRRGGPTDREARPRRRARRVQGTIEKPITATSASASGSSRHTSA